MFKKYDPELMKNFDLHKSPQKEFGIVPKPKVSNEKVGQGKDDADQNENQELLRNLDREKSFTEELSIPQIANDEMCGQENIRLDER